MRCIDSALLFIIEITKPRVLVPISEEEVSGRDCRAYDYAVSENHQAPWAAVLEHGFARHTIRVQLGMHCRLILRHLLHARGAGVEVRGLVLDLNPRQALTSLVCASANLLILSSFKEPLWSLIRSKQDLNDRCRVHTHGGRRVSRTDQ